MKPLTAVSGGLALLALAATSSLAQIQNRTPSGGANVAKRTCIGGANAGALCRADSECSPGDCFDYNVFDLTVNLVTSDGTGWIPSASQMTAIEGYFRRINDTLADVTDGQMALGTVSLVVNNGAPDAAVQLQAGECSSGGACVTNADCVGGGGCNNDTGWAHLGGWGNYGRITMGVYCLVQEPQCFPHEFIHFIARARDEYQGALDDGVDNNGNGQIDECGENVSLKRCLGGTNDGQPCMATANCFGGGTCRQIVCHDAGPPASPTEAPGCLMQCCLSNTVAELCTDADHDPDRDTDQSQCNENRSCWTQLGIEWPSVIQVPTAAPDPGPTTSPTTVVFLNRSAADRVVAVIDRSLSMSAEEPSRIAVAVTNARDFVGLLGDTAQLGVASFASASTKDFPPEPGLRTLATAIDRTAAGTAIDGLLTRANGNTRIGAGLRTARDMLLENGGAVTSNTHVLLLTDGLNNEPGLDPQGDLDAALAELSAAGIPVFVTCIGQARNSTQCSYVADSTAGRFVDSAETANVYDALVEFAAAAQGQEIAAASLGTPIGDGQTSGPVEIRIEDGVEAAQFVLSWTRAESDLDLLLFRPDGSPVDPGLKTTGSRGEFFRILAPNPGTWTLRAVGRSVPVPVLESFRTRVIVDHPQVNAIAGLARATIQWPEGFLLGASPILGGHSIAGCQVEARVVKPGGDSETLALHDDGVGDSQAHDGLYQALFRNFTAGDGIYTFEVRTRCAEGVAEIIWQAEPGGTGASPPLPTLSSFERFVRFSGTVTGVPPNLPPVADICQDVRAECQGVRTPVTLSGLCSSDPEGAGLTFAWSSPTGTFADPSAATPTGRFPLGRNAVSLVVTDPLGAASPPDAGLVVVADTTSPEITRLRASPDVLWPPNHQMEPVRLAVRVADSCDPAPRCSITGVRSDDGGSPKDWKVTGPLSLSLRAERTGRGAGRTYSVSVRCGDASGNHTLGKVSVTVPHDQGKKK
jgi:hypothetical protein